MSNSRKQDNPIVSDTESKSHQTNKAAKSFIYEGFRSGFQPAIHLGREVGKLMGGKNSEENCKDVAILSPLGWVPALATGAACALFSPAYAGYVALSRSQNLLSQDDLNWLLNRGTELIKSFDARKLKAFSEILKIYYTPEKYTSSNSSKIIAIALGFEKVELFFQRGDSNGYGCSKVESDYTLEQKKDLLSHYINYYKNNHGKQLFHAIFQTLKKLDPMLQLDAHSSVASSDIVVEYSAPSIR